jgi:hypothetical protein
MGRPSLLGGKLMTWRQLSALILFFMLGLAFSPGVQAGEVGNFTQVEGQVELLKSGQPPAIPVEVQTGVEVKDVIITKAESRTKLRLLDDTTLTIAPLSQITLESYMCDEQKCKRQAVTEIAQGLVHVVVPKIFPSKEPDFLLKTQTAIMGVRGTEFYILVIENPSPPSESGSAPDFFKAVRVRALETTQAPVSTDVFVKSGRVIMNSSNPNIKDTVLLGANQSSRVILNQPPGPRIPLARNDFQRLKSSLVTGVTRAQVGHTKNPKELLQKLPVKPPRLEKSAPGKGKMAPGPSKSAPTPPLKPKVAPPKPGDKAPKPATKPPAAPVKPPQAKEKPAAPAMKPLKPAEKPSPPAAKQPLKKELTQAPPAKKEAARAKAPKPAKKEPARAAPAKPRKEPARVKAPKPPASPLQKPAPPSKPPPSTKAAPPAKAAPPPKSKLPEK